jgi:hypothetical protein
MTPITWNSRPFSSTDRLVHRRSERSPDRSVPAGQNVTIAHAFEYAPDNPSTITGEMSHMTTPLGGQLWWQYTTFTYNPSGTQYTGQTYRQVSSRSMAPSGSKVAL